MKGYVYILSNQSMPGLLKIGRCKRGGEKRASELYQTGVPTPFRVEFEILVVDCIFTESQAHRRFNHCRVPGREFFKLNLQDAIVGLMSEALEDYGHYAIPCEMAAAETTITDISALTNEHPYIVSSALQFIPKDAFLAALETYKGKLAKGKRG